MDRCVICCLNKIGRQKLFVTSATGADNMPEFLLALSNFAEKC